MFYVFEVLKQTLILLKKNFLLYIRRWKSTGLQLLSPVIILVILVVMKEILQANYAADSAIHQPVEPIHGIQVPTLLSLNDLKFYDCKPNGGRACYKLVYSANGISFGDQVMDLLISDYNLKQDTDYKMFTTKKEMENWMYTHQNQTMFGVSFIPNGALDTIDTISYTLYYNRSREDLKTPLLSLQNLIDNNIVYLRMQELGRTQELTDPRNSIQVDYKSFPQPPQTKNGEVLLYNYSGPTFFSIGAMIVLIISLNSLVVEKEFRLRFAMVMMGMKESAYFISWFITFLVICAIFSLVNVIGGMIFQISIFLNTDFIVLYVLFFSFTFSLICLAFLLSTFIKESKSALVLGFTVLAISFILNLTVSNSNIIYMLFDSSTITPFLVVVCSFYPPFNFAKVFIDIAVRALPVYDAAQRKYVTGPGYTISDLFVGTNTYDYVPASWLGILFLFLNGLLFLILYWYCDNVISDGNGVRKSPIFFLYPSFWGIKRWKSKTKLNPHDEADLNQMETDDIKNEFNKARDFNQNAIVRIISLRRSFSSLIAKIALKILPAKLKKFFSEKKALKGLNLIVQDNQCVSLLGHNGAGKSTTMNILTGLFEQSSGEAFIAGLNVRDSMEDIRKQLGMCPQHDILWDDLTAEEHLELFGDLKGVPRKQISEEVLNFLESVDLSKVGHHLTKTYSGGMKRRLSICIACIGNPKLILLDEPTTGLDPYSRKKAWNLIHKMKEGRAMILTTHAMDEADYLSDKIAIMAHGQLKCVGNSLSIKAQYGSGYNLMVVANTGHEQHVLSMVKGRISNVNIVSESAGNFIFNIPKQSLPELSDLISDLESSTFGIKDWGISQTTLEEVYLKVTQKSDFSYAPTKDANKEQQELADVKVM